MRLIFAGSSQFAVPALRGLLEVSPPVLVLSRPERPAGRNLKPRLCPLAEFAQSKGLPLSQPEDVNSPDSVRSIRSLEADLLITASYGALLRKPLRESTRLGAINLHPSLLPLHRGATPVQSALLKGDSLTGTTIFALNSRLDAGPILAQRELPILPEDDHASLEGRLAELSARLLLDLLPVLERDGVVGREQDHSRASYCAKLDKDDLVLDWNMEANTLHNRIRAFSPLPGAYTLLRGERLKILAARPLPEPPSGTPGSLGQVVKNTGFTVNCRDAQLLILKVQPAGKRAMDAWAYQLGARLKPGERFAGEPPKPDLENT